MPRRRSSNLARQETGADGFIVFVMGLAPTASWEELKDLAREGLGQRTRRTEEEVNRILGRVHVFESTEWQPKHGYIPVRGEEHGRAVYSYASDYVWNGYPLTATLVKWPALELQELGSASAGYPQPYPHPSVSGGFQHPSTAVVPVSYLTSAFPGDSSLGTVNVASASFLAQGYENNVQAYCSCQPTADRTCFAAHGQSPPPAYEQQTRDYQRANLHWIGAQGLWPHQQEHPGNGYGAGNWIIFEEPHARNIGGGAPPWATSHSVLPGPQYLPVTNAVLYSVPPVMPMEPGQSAPGPPHPLQYVRFAVSQITHNNNDGMPVNIMHGAVPTEARGVFVQNLSYSATSADVENLMGDAGSIVRCEINTDSGTGRSKGSATVQFTSAEDVTKALDMFNGTRFMGRALTVRLDKNQEANSDAEISTSASSGENEQEPIIVDGSTGSV